MRTTLDISDDVLFAAKELARREKKTLGEVISDLARRAFATPTPTHPTSSRTPAPLVSERLATYGIHPLPKRGGIVSNELIDRLRDAEGI
jgi:hypothetical protein